LTEGHRGPPHLLGQGLGVRQRHCLQRLGGKLSERPVDRDAIHHCVAGHASPDFVEYWRRVTPDCVEEHSSGGPHHRTRIPELTPVNDFRFWRHWCGLVALTFAQDELERGGPDALSLRGGLRTRLEAAPNRRF